jgi:two-component system, cell cycle sensor histidine kinase and response regulator CckA
MAIEAFKVLIMEDNDLVSRLYKMMFEDTVWNITLAENGTEAVRAYKERYDSGRPFDIVILDLDINGETMAGLKVFEELKKIDPNVRAILCSGSIDEAVYEKCVRIGFCATLNKPFTAPALQDLLAAVLPDA